MLRRTGLPASVGLFVGDLGLFGSLVFAAHLLRAGPMARWLPFLRAVPPMPAQVPGIVTICLISMACFHWAGFYGAGRRTVTLGPLVGRLALGFGTAFVFSSAVALFVSRTRLPRTAIVLGFAMASVAFLFQRLLLRAFVKSMRRRGRNLRHVVIVGAGRRAARIAALLRDHEEWGLRIEGYLDDGETRGEIPLDAPCLGGAKDLARVLDERVVDRVFVAVPGERLHEFEAAVRDCEEVGVPVHVAADVFGDALSRGRFERLDGQAFLTFDRVDHPPLGLAVKRLLDVFGSAVGLVVLSPLLVLIALVIKLTSRGPVLFVQDRAGRNGRQFRMYKFRSMVRDAERRRQDLAHLNELDGPVFKIKNDPRVTFVGRILRRFSLDELPQLWNILKGDMSLVGPRPLWVDEARACERWQKRRQSMRPGLTCLWQVNGRSRITDFDEWARLDLEYIDEWSVGLDVKILFLTIPAVLFGSGAQ